jgi:Uma2 family endonuclease
MATSPQISLTEYMSTSYRPDREYVDGVLVERNVGEWKHGRLQVLLGAWFGSQEDHWQVASLIACRVQVSPTRVRVPDVLLITLKPQVDVPVEPPVLAVEVLSTEDSLAEIKEKAADYFEMGVAAVWIIDPQVRAGRWSSGIGSGWIQADRLEVPATDIYVEMSYLWERLTPPDPNKPESYSG